MAGSVATAVAVIRLDVSMPVYCRRILLPVLLVLGVCQPAAADTVADTQAKLRSCDAQAASAVQHHACVFKATPRKCRSYVSGAHGRFYSPLVQQQWFVCLRSCDDASLRSRTSGECSRTMTTTAK